MPTLEDWLMESANDSDYDVLTAEERAVFAWRRIQDRPSSIVLRRNNVDQPAQVMRVEFNNSATWIEGTIVRTGKQMLTLFGVRNHPSVPDTDIQRADRCVINGTQYQVMSVLTPPGEVQALLES